MKILVVRNDKIGDFVLSLPAFKAIKTAFPHAIVVALVPNYTKDIAKACDWIDDVIIDPKDKRNISKFASAIKLEQFDAAICLFSDSYNATLVRKAGISVRVAPATKWVQILYTNTLMQRRSRSEKPEFQYNLDLAYYFIEVLRGKSKEVSPYGLLSYNTDELLKQKAKLLKIGVKFDNKVCFIHPSTGGSSSTLNKDQWSELILFLNDLDQFHFVITAGPGEEVIANNLVEYMVGKVDRITLYDKNDGVDDFMRSIACADLFIAGSTGPLHIAGALDVPTIGFYPSKRSSTALRWRTLNSEEKRFAISPSDKELELGEMSISSIFPMLSCWYLSVLNTI